MLKAFAQYSVLSILAGSLLTACQTVPYNPSTNNDTTAPAVNLLILRAGAPDVEVQGRLTPSPNVAINLGALPQNGSTDFSVLATATDNESGIKHIRLIMMRTVCYALSGGGYAKAYYGTVTRKEATYTDPAHAPVQATLGDTGLIDNTATGQTHPSDGNLLVWINANQVRHVGVGVWARWSIEATNFAGQTSYSEVINVNSGDQGCNPP